MSAIQGGSQSRFSQDKASHILEQQNFKDIRKDVCAVTATVRIDSEMLEVFSAEGDRTGPSIHQGDSPTPVSDRGRFPAACIDFLFSAKKKPITMVHGQGGVKFQNWAKTYGCSPEMYFQPATVEELKEILDLARQRSKKVKVVGGGHSPSDIACTDDFMIHMGRMNKILKVGVMLNVRTAVMDKEKKQVKVEAGILLSDLNVELNNHGLALPILGAVSDVAAAGVIGTGTHNTGIRHGIFATQDLLRKR
uniref:Uncharacterized protein n=1 Tax=Sphaerodactylus townsendi TaxID=933632 RepID=A0ACB8G8P1_9SAUR